MSSRQREARGPVLRQSHPRVPREEAGAGARAARLAPGSAGSFGSAAAGWSLGRWEVVGRMLGRSVGRCWVCLGPGIIYPVPSLVPIPTVFAINSSILAGAVLTSSTSGASGKVRVSPTDRSCPRLWSRAAGPVPQLCNSSAGGQSSGGARQRKPAGPTVP